MKLGDDVLLEIVEIVREAIAEGKDVSDLMRDLDVEVQTGEVSLSESYKIRKNRKT